jgi:hypothetical protein
MPARRYSDQDIARFAIQDYQSLDKYQQRLVRGYNRGLSRTQAVGHASQAKKETPIAKLSNTPKLEKGTGKVAPVSRTPQKPTIPKKERKGYGRHVQKVGKTRSVTRVNAATEKGTSSLQKRLEKAPDNAKLPVIYLANSKTGEEVRAVSKTQTVGGLKQAIDIYVSQGLSWDDAFYAVIADSYDVYEEGDNYETDQFPATVSNVVMYFEVA